MADGNILSAGTQVDLSGIQSLKVELAVLQEQYRSVSNDIKQSVNRVVDAEKQATDAIAAGHESLAASIQAAANAERTSLDGLIQKQIEVKASLESIAPSAQHAVSELQAVSGTLRTFEGNSGIRAAERFLTSIPGLGTALQSAFPLVGAIALGEVLVRMGEHLGKALGLWGGISEAEKKATEEAEKLGKELKSIDEKTASIQNHIYAIRFGDVAAQAKETADYSTKLITDANVINSLLRIQADERQKINEEIALGSNPGQSFSDFAKTAGSDKAYAEYKKTADALKKAREEEFEDQQKSVEQSLVLLQKSGDQTDKQYKAITDAEKKYAEEQKKAHEKEIKDETEYWRQVEEDYKLGEKLKKEQLETLVIQLREEGSLLEAEARATEKTDRAIAESGRKAVEEQKKNTEEMRRAIEEAGAASEAGLSGQRGGIGEQKKLSDKGIGGSTPTQEIAYLQALKDVDQQIITEKVQTQLKLIQLDSLGDPAKLQADMTKLVQIQKQGQQTMLNDTTNILVQQQAQYTKFFNQLNQEGTKAFNDLLTKGPKAFVTDLNQIWTKMVTDFADKLVLMALKWAEMEAINIVTHGAAVQANQSIDLAANLKKANDDAVLAAKNAYTWASSWGGPVAGAIAAGIAYPAVLALGSFETGTNYVPQTGMYQLHKGEAVVPAQYNPAAGGSGGGIGSVTQNVYGAASHSPQQIADMAVGRLQSMMRRQNQIPA